MARDLDYTIIDSFSDSYPNCNCWHNRNRHFDKTRHLKYLELPIKEGVFELPVFAVRALYESLITYPGKNIDAIAVSLDTYENIPRYKSLDRYMRDVLVETYRDSRLVRLEVKQGNDTILYYGTQGAVFDKDFRPLMVSLWQIQGYTDITTSKRRYKFLKPIIRIDPTVFLNRADPMQRYIAGKFLNTGLSINMMPYHINVPFKTFLRSEPNVTFDEHAVDTDIKVEIGRMDFIIRQPDVPSVSINNKQLLQLAVDHGGGCIMTIDEYFGDWSRVLDLQEADRLIHKLSTVNTCPLIRDVFKAFRLCPLDSLRAVILGMDPYPDIYKGKPRATGIAFANSQDVPEGAYSPSLEVLRESVIDYTIPHRRINFDASLEKWESQGVLLLNSALTCERGRVGSHTLLWRPFIDTLLTNLSICHTGIVYVLMGAVAQSFEGCINKQFNHIFRTKHPSWYARQKIKMPSDIWNEINNILIGQNGNGIEWYKEY